MYYDFAITIPANTAQTSPVYQEMKLTQGVLQRLEIQFPAGCAALAHCQILHHGHHYLPTNPDGSFASDNYTIPIDDEFPLDAKPFVLKAVCWNDDDTYEHTITIRIGVLRGDSTNMIARTMTALAKFLKLAGVKV